jgi:hypothetical protein
VKEESLYRLKEENRFNRQYLEMTSRPADNFVGLEITKNSE